MYSRTSTLLRRSCQYLLRSPIHPKSTFSLSARSYSAINAAMADATSGVTADLLKSKLIDQLQAEHVEIEDLSGMIASSQGEDRKRNYMGISSGYWIC